MLVTDNELLGLYVHNDDPMALEQLVRRHSKMVMGVCRSLLWQQADAEDAFQAVFLLLSRKAPKLLKHNSVGGWLHEAALRISLKHRSKITRKREVAMSEEPKGNASEPWQAIADSRDNELLHLEVSRLPKRYRDVIVLCHLEGKSRAEAASVLDVTTVSVKASLARGRNLLRRRLMKRGIAAWAALGAVSATTSVAAARSAESVTVSVSELLIQSALAHCKGTLRELAVGVDSVGTSADIVRSLVDKELSIMNLGLAQNSLAIAAGIVAVCSLSVAGVVSQISIADGTQVIVSPIAAEYVSAGTATVFQEDRETNDSPAQGDAESTFSRQTSKKTANETWLEYLNRLQSMKLISDAQIREWKSGKAITIKREMPVQRIREEIRTRKVPVTGFRKGTNVDGLEVENPITRTETRNYTIKIPYTEVISVDVTIPTIGSQPADAKFTRIADGFPNDSDQAPPDKNKFLNNATLIKPMMQIRPRQSDAVFTKYHPSEFDRLRIRKLGPDSKGFELIDSKTKNTIRKFIDTNNDNKLDTWIFFEDGVETYLDADLDFNGKVDMCRYTDGDEIRYGFDENEDGKIDSIF